jgi:thiosulfate dehydrogenase [quinone] large subunit
MTDHDGGTDAQLEQRVASPHGHDMPEIANSTGSGMTTGALISLRASDASTTTALPAEPSQFAQNAAPAEKRITMTSTENLTIRPSDDKPGAAPDGSQGRALRLTAAVARLLLGFTFLWAFFDKMFGLGYTTTSSNAWIHSGSPTYGFLAHVKVGPFQGLFHSLAGNWIVNWLFMLGLLGIGVALVAGIALRLMAISGVVMLVMMWAAEWPLARHNSTGALTGSTSPFVDYHLVYAISLVMIACIAGAGNTWGFGDRWAKTEMVRHHPILR